MLIRPAVRGFFKLLILEALREEPMHGYEIIKKMESKLGGYAPSPGIVYPTLRCLEIEGLIESQQTGRKRIYKITAKGLEHLMKNEELLTSFSEKHRKFLSFKKMIPDGFFPLIEKLISVSDSLSPEQKEIIRNAFLKLENELRAVLGD